MIKDGKIEDVLSISCLSQLPQDIKTEDLGSLLVFPGLIDLNVSFASDGASTVTKQALSGGTTLVCSLEQASGDLYTDILPISQLSDQTSDLTLPAFAHKSYLVPQGPNPQVLTQLSKLQYLPQDVPLIVHPELATADNMNLSMKKQMKKKTENSTTLSHALKTTALKLWLMILTEEKKMRSQG